MNPERLSELQALADGLHSHRFKEDWEEAARDLANAVPELLGEIERLRAVVAGDTERIVNLEEEVQELQEEIDRLQQGEA
jgi:prefoldin subunit 5